jgi:hypothetical protein
VFLLQLGFLFCFIFSECLKIIKSRVLVFTWMLFVLNKAKTLEKDCLDANYLEKKNTAALLIFIFNSKNKKSVYKYLQDKHREQVLCAEWEVNLLTLLFPRRLPWMRDRGES